MYRKDRRDRKGKNNKIGQRRGGMDVIREIEIETDGSRTAVESSIGANGK
jgi:hypothetical protein